MDREREKQQPPVGEWPFGNGALERNGRAMQPKTFYEMKPGRKDVSVCSAALDGHDESCRRDRRRDSRKRETRAPGRFNQRDGALFDYGRQSAAASRAPFPGFRMFRVS